MNNILTYYLLIFVWCLTGGTCQSDKTAVPNPVASGTPSPIIGQDHGSDRLIRASGWELPIPESLLVVKTYSVDLKTKNGNGIQARAVRYSPQSDFIFSQEFPDYDRDDGYV